MRFSNLLHSAATGLVAMLAAAPAIAETLVDLELVLAVDVSRSMDLDEQHLQRDGYVAAMQHPDVVDAIRSGPLGRIALTYVEWAGPQSQSVVVPWTLIDSEAAATRVAALLSAAPLGPYTGTSISGGLLFAAEALVENSFAGMRRVIDVSGDGPNNRGLPVRPISTAIAASGVTINGLPLTLKAPVQPYSIANLDVYYEDCVIGGPGAFILPVREKSQLAAAIRRKLVLEIAGTPPLIIRVAETRPEPRIDCMIGERLIERWLEK
ncbi:MAG TPA: DUF1194 domain-containing protein [Aestuariivirgaceae bacterium]|nr:DUF1194 domain-containing protein [Aestuariivirgaceae bacterium]